MSRTDRTDSQLVSVWQRARGSCGTTPKHRAMIDLNRLTLRKKLINVGLLSTKERKKSRKIHFLGKYNYFFPVLPFVMYLKVWITIEVSGEYMSSHLLEAFRLFHYVWKKLKSLWECSVIKPGKSGCLSKALNLSVAIYKVSCVLWKLPKS